MKSGIFAFSIKASNENTLLCKFFFNPKSNLKSSTRLNNRVHLIVYCCIHSSRKSTNNLKRWHCRQRSEIVADDVLWNRQKVVGFVYMQLSIYIHICHAFQSHLLFNFLWGYKAMYIKSGYSVNEKSILTWQNWYKKDYVINLSSVTGQFS